MYVNAKKSFNCLWPLCNVIISDTMEARYLYNYAQSLELLDDDPLNNPEASLEGYNCKYFMQTWLSRAGHYLKKCILLIYSGKCKERVQRSTTQANNGRTGQQHATDSHIWDCLCLSYFLWHWQRCKTSNSVTMVSAKYKFLFVFYQVQNKSLALKLYSHLFRSQDQETRSSKLAHK